MTTVTKYFCDGCGWSYNSAIQAVSCEAQADCEVMVQDYSCGHPDFKHFPIMFCESYKIMDAIIKKHFPNSVSNLIINIDPESGTSTVQIVFSNEKYVWNEDRSLMHKELQSLPAPHKYIQCHFLGTT